jgi:hypothetical protein
MRLVSYLDIVALQYLYQLAKNLPISIRHGRRLDGGRSKQRIAVQSWEHLRWCREEMCKAKRKVVWAVSWSREKVALYLEGCSSDVHENVSAEELLGEARQRVELRIRK